MQNAIIKRLRWQPFWRPAQCSQPWHTCTIEANVGFTTDYIWRGMTQNVEIQLLRRY